MGEVFVVCSANVAGPLVAMVVRSFLPEEEGHRSEDHGDAHLPHAGVHLRRGRRHSNCRAAGGGSPGVMGERKEEEEDFRKLSVKVGVCVHIHHISLKAIDERTTSDSCIAAANKGGTVV